MAEVRIKVGASADASIETTFQKPAVAAARMAAKVAKESAAAGRALALGIAAGVKGATKEMNRLHGEAQRFNKLYDDLGRSRGTASGIKNIQTFAKETKRAFDDSARAAAKYASEAEKAMSRASSATARAAVAQARNERRQQTALGASMAADIVGAQKWNARGPGRFAKGMGYWGSGRMMPLTRTLGKGTRLAGDLARGAGIEMDASSMMRGYVNREKLSTTIAHMGFVPGAEGPAGQHVSPADIERQAVATSKATGVGSEDILKGLEKFTGFSSDLKTGRDLMTDMAKISSATGANMEDVGEGAGKIAKQLGDIPNKGEAVKGIMLSLAGMGRQGAVDIKDFAAELAKIAPMAKNIGGDVGTNIKNMGVLMQLGMEGGAKGASQASTDAVRFIESFNKSSTLKNWTKKHDIDPFDKNGNLQDPKKLLLAALVQTGGDLHKMPEGLGELFKSAPARQVINPLQRAFVAAGGGFAGEKAASDAYEKIATTALSAAEMEREHAETLQTATAKAQQFQARLEEISDKVAVELIPAMEAFAPKILSAVDSLASLTTWGAENPGSALAAAVTASFAQAGLQQIMRMGVEKMFSSVAGGLTGGAITVGAMAVTAAILEINEVARVEKERQENAERGLVAGTGALHSSSPEEVKKAIADAEASAGAAKNTLTGKTSVTENFERGLALTFAPEAEKTRDEALHATLKDQTVLLQQLRDHLANIVTNTAAGKDPVKASHGGRMPVNFERTHSGNS